MSDERTREELTDALDDKASEACYGEDFELYTEAARRLREPEGERIEGWAFEDHARSAHSVWFFESHKQERSEFWQPATLILHPQEPESDG